MPPTAFRRPDNATYDAVAAWLETELDVRLSPSESGSTGGFSIGSIAPNMPMPVRDLLGVEIDGASMLPPDAQPYGFDTNADALSMEPALLDRTDRGV